MKLSNVLYSRGHNMVRWKRYQLFYTGKRKVFIRDLVQQVKDANVALEEATEVVKENLYYP